jgi:Protein of unknown function (DUF2786)
MADKKAIEKVQQLVALASDEGASPEEARTSALKAIQIMRENDLVVVSASELEASIKAVDGARLALRDAESKMNSKMLMGAALGFGLSKFIVK